VIGHAHWTRKQGKWRLFWWGASGQSRLVGEVTREGDGVFAAELHTKETTRFATLAEARAHVVAATGRKMDFWKPGWKQQWNGGPE
jgi:hypothetical protein